MDTYIIHFKSSPGPDSTFNHDTLKATAIVYVTAKTFSQAKTKAESHIMDHHWLSQEITFYHRLKANEIDGLDLLESYLFEKSKRREVAVFFSAHQKTNTAPIKFQAIKPASAPINTKQLN